ncbi:MAG TPA: PilZ domain-containing protein [Methylomirabilota bacterium]|nr:PilZ domain-containing protein [Methylomirabilota bacterium]
MLGSDAAHMRPRSNLERRRNQRIPTPSGMWVSWKLGKLNETSRVEDFSMSGAFIAAANTVPVGSRLELHFSLPEGQLQVQAVVRNIREGRGMGVEFVSMAGKDLDLILAAVKRMLG